MTKIIPFKAIRPVRDKVHLVTSKPIYSYKKNILKATLQDNPFTFLHIINPEFGCCSKTKFNSIERFELSKAKYDEFLKSGILIQDPTPHFYIYRQSKDGHEYLGLIAGASVEEYRKGKIKKHEATLSERESVFVEYLEVVGYNADPVLLSYTDNEKKIEKLLETRITENPEYEYTTTDNIKHELWLFKESEADKVIKAFSEIKAVYIADGHHRTSSSLSLFEKRSKNKIRRPVNEKYFLAFFLNETRLNVIAYNRLIKTLNGYTREQFLRSIEKKFHVLPLKKAAKPMALHQITMCVEGHWYKLNFKDFFLQKEHPVNSLDTEILTQHILTPILGIKDLRTDKNIEFVSGAEPLGNSVKSIEKGHFKVGFFLYPLNINDIKKVADNNMITSPKSTWIEPKLKSGLTIYNVNE